SGPPATESVASVRCRRYRNRSTCATETVAARWLVPARSRRPVIQVLEVLGRRWALRILWELRRGPRTFRALREACDDVSPSSLNQRLAELRELGAIGLVDDGYALTASGEQLGKIVLSLHGW